MSAAASTPVPMMRRDTSDVALTQQFRRGLQILSVVYAVAALAFLAAAPSPLDVEAIADWVAVPSQLLALAGAAAVTWVRRREAAHTGLIWGLITAFCATSIVATVAWNLWRARGAALSISLPDVLYFLDYGALCAAFALIYVRLGGSFRTARAWLELTTMIVAVLGALWVVLLQPALQRGTRFDINTGYFVGYSLVLSILMATGALVFIRLPDVLRRPIPLLLLGAAVAEVIWEIGWLATWVERRNYVGFFYNYGDVACFTLIAWAAALCRRSSGREDAASPERAAYSFLPALAALLTTSVVTASIASRHLTDAGIVVGLVVLVALLLATRYLAVRGELAALQRSFVKREADARVTELVRHLPDALLVVDAAGTVGFASPAAAQVLSSSPGDLVGSRGEMIAGTSHMPALSRFLERVATEPVVPPIEIRSEDTGVTPRVLRIAGANHLGNPRIRGLTLTVSDVSEQRALERDVLEVASQERLRLAGDIHDGLGQQLAGISMMLQSASTRPDLDANGARAEFKDILGHTTEAISIASALARGLSPTYVVRGSLRNALLQLATSDDADVSVDVDVDPTLEDRSVDDIAADHVMRIVHEAMRNARRHGHCTCIDIALSISGNDVVLTIADNGTGIDPSARASAGIGLRLMEYRARLIGAELSITPRAEGGTTVRVAAPMRSVFRASAGSR